MVRNLAYGVSAGTSDLKNYERWVQSNDKAIERKQNVKNQIEKIFTKEMKRNFNNDKDDNQMKRDAGI